MTERRRLTDNISAVSPLRGAIDGTKPSYTAGFRRGRE